MLNNYIIELIDELITVNKETVKSLLLPGLCFKIDELPLKTDSSKIGGYPPILRKDWPIFNDNPLLFIGQVSLADISYMHDILPESGFLCFFISTNDIENRWPDKKGEFKVIYVDDVPEPDSPGFKTIKEHGISFFEVFTLPSYQEHMITTNNLTDDDLQAMEEIEFEVQSRLDIEYNLDSYEDHQVLGHPGAIQGTVRFWWAMKYLGFKDDELSEDKIDLARKEEDKFIMLLQLNFGDSKIDVDSFGDAVAYFGIHQKDLQNKNFDNVVLVMQNT